MNLLFPISVTASTILTGMLIGNAAASDALPHEVAGSTFLATLMALAVLEHWFLVLPMPSAELWTWGLASRKHESEAQVQDARAKPPGQRDRDVITATVAGPITGPIAATGVRA